MLNTKLLATTITMRREVSRSSAVAELNSVSKFLTVLYHFCMCVFHLQYCHSVRLKQSHLDKQAHSISPQAMRAMARQCSQKMGLQIRTYHNEINLHDPELPTIMEQIMNVWILRFLEKVAHMPEGRLTREVLRSHANP
jgi:hypothetical protein